MTYPGGKAQDGTFQKIINQMPPHRVYVEPFLGGGAIMRLKRPAVASIGIDSDDHVANCMWRGDEIPGLRVLHADALYYLTANPLSQTLTHDTLIYCDPPYLMSTRASQRPLYRRELASEEEHAELLAAIKALPCMVMISGYWSELYARELAGWRTISWQAITRGGTIATEWLWMNFDEPMELHDYRFIGDNFRQRERIKRKQARWRARLARMKASERYAMLSVLQELRGTHTPEMAMLPPAASPE
jgi:hypothetical protein